MENIDIFIILSYTLIIVLTGCYFSSQKNSKLSLITGGKGFSGNVMGISMFATYVSCIALVSLPSALINDGLIVLLPFLTLPLSGLIANRYFVVSLRNKGYDSVYHYIRDKIGNAAAVLVSVLYIFLALSRMILIAYIISSVLSKIIGVESIFILFSLGLVVAGYSLMGGFKAVIWTDVIHGTLVLAILLIFIGYGIYSFPYDFFSFVKTSTFDTLIYCSKSSDLISKLDLLNIGIYGFLSNFQVFIGDQGMAQRFLYARSAKEGQKAVLMGTGFILLSITLITMVSYIFFAVDQTSLSASLSNNQYVSNTFVVEFIANHAPIGFRGLFVVMILSAAMSSIDSELHAISTTFLLNIYKEKKLGSSDGSQLIFLSKASTLIIAIVSMIVGCLMTETVALSDWWGIDSCISGGISGIIFLCFFKKWIDKKWLPYSGILMIVTAIWATFSRFLPQEYSSIKNPFNSMSIMVFCVISISLFSLVGIFSKKLIMKYRIQNLDSPDHNTFNPH